MTPEEKDLRVWHIPQVGMKNTFYTQVKDVMEADKIINLLARYDTFQFENKIKPDYNNVSGLEIFESGEWCEWVSDEGETLEEWVESLDTFGEGYVPHASN